MAEELPIEYPIPSGRRTAPEPDAAQLTCEFFPSVQDLRASKEVWQELADHSESPNVYFEPWFALAAANHLGAPAALVIRHEDQWVGLALLTIKKSRLPFLQTISTWRNIYCWDGAPLVRTGYASAVITMLLKWHSAETRYQVMLLHNFPGEGHLAEALAEAAPRCALLVEQVTRPMIEPKGTFDDFLLADLSSGHRQTIRRDQRKLREAGDLKIRKWQPGDPLDEWIDIFLKLESSGWKGEQGTSLDSSPASREFFRELIHEANLQQSASFIMMTINGQPIAMTTLLSSKTTSYGFKLAVDEAWKKYSPGIQLLMAQVLDLYKQKTHVLDTCARPEAGYVYRLMSQRRLVNHWMIAKPGLLGRLVVLATSIWMIFSSKRPFRSDLAGK